MLFIFFDIVIPFVICGKTIMFEILVSVLFYFTSRAVHFRASSISNIGSMNVFLWIDTQITNVQFLIFWSWMSVSWIDTLHLDTSMILFHWNIFIVLGTCQAKESHIESLNMHAKTGLNASLQSLNQHPSPCRPSFQVSWMLDSRYSSASNQIIKKMLTLYTKWRFCFDGQKIQLNAGTAHLLFRQKVCSSCNVLILKPQAFLE